MRTLGNTVVLAALLAATACGSRTGTGDSSSAASADWHGCTQAALKSGKDVGVADLDGDGHLDPVWFASSGRCRGLASATANGVIGADLRGLDVDPSTIRAVQTRGADAQVLLLVGERSHPRGGRQWHLVGSDGHRVAEVTVGGGPLLPFYATDGGGQPMTATCPARGGVAVITARTHEPPGIVLAWDVTRTTYRIDGFKAVGTNRATVATAAADPTLRKQMPHLFDGTMFTGCEPSAAG
jgi:hypothetical protein